MTNLDDTQKKQIASWIAEGLKLSEIQKRIESDFGLTLTYMEARFLLDDLALAPKDPEPAEPVKPEDALEPELLPEEPGAGFGGVQITVDQLVRTGALISGQVTFSDSKKAAWYLDQYGRLGLVPEEKDTKPSEQDLKEFQTQLQILLEKTAY
jgi:hypothetical protein